MVDDKITITMEVGRLNWNAVRNVVQELSYVHGWNLTLTEGSGRISKPFYIRGSRQHVEAFTRIVKAWESE